MYTEGRQLGLDQSPNAGPGKFSVHDLSIGVLHLGVKTPALEQAGFRTIADLEGISRDQIVRILTVGPRTADLLLRNRKVLLAVSDPATGTDWVKYCEEIGLPLLPRVSRPTSGEEFLACLPKFLDDLARHLNDATLGTILRERICEPPDHQKTLDEIASRTSPPLTRERIRQKEKKLLQQLTGGLLNDAYAGLAIHFHPDFCRWWRMAADRLSHLEEIEFGDFVENLADAWSVPQDAVMAQLPSILAIVTGEPQMSGEFRSASRIDPRLFGFLKDEVCDLPVQRLRLGKYAEKLTEAGIETVGDIITQLRSGNQGSVGGAMATRTVEHANLLASCFSDTGDLDWLTYRRKLGLPLMPSASASDPAAFVSGIRDTIEQLLEVCSITKRAADIYRLRTSRDTRSQMTLRAVAGELKTHLPTIKREETVFLRFLHDVLINHDFSTLPVWLEESWLSLWGEARKVFEASERDFTHFSGNLAWRWRLTDREIMKAAPTIWAVFTGYPDDRRSRNKVSERPAWERQMSASVSVPVGRIRLKGFRRVH